MVVGNARSLATNDSVWSLAFPFGILLCEPDCRVCLGSCYSDPRFACAMKFAKLQFRMAIWFTLWVIAGLCGLPMFDHTTIFWVTIVTAFVIAKESER